jgi:3-oxoacyl-(acyl-carrier-protein) synthase
MAVNTPVADTLDGFYAALLDGRSAATRWRSVDTTRTYAKIGADLVDYDAEARAAIVAARLPSDIAERLHRLVRRVPWSPRLGVVLAADAAADAGLTSPELAGAHVVVGGHNLSAGFSEGGFARFAADPATLDVGHELYSLDTTQAACVSELLGSRGPAWTVGGACASGNLAFQAGVREIQRHGASRVVVLGAVAEPSIGGLHAFALIGALSIASFNDAPELASRPWDTRREGFVPAHGGAALVLEERDAAIARGARIHAEVSGVAVCSDANHLTVPDEAGQARAMTLALRRAGLAPEDIDYVSAHATSTPAGDLVELRAIRRALGSHAERVRINATKSMIGHTFSAAALVEGVAAILQMNAGLLHTTRNVDVLDPAVDLDVCAGGPATGSRESVRWPVRHLLNNAFGFGGINAVSVLSRGDA